MCEVTDIVRKVCVKSSTNHEEQLLRFRIIWTHNQNILKIDISDDANPLLQCFVEITENCFKEIKKGQGINTASLDDLKVELVKLFEKCAGSEQKDAKFFLLLEEGGQPAGFNGYDIMRKRQLRIVEKSALKNLVHFTFEVGEATDEEIKAALLAQLKEVKNLCTSRDGRIVELERSVKQLTEEAALKLNELAVVQNELERQKVEHERDKKETVSLCEEERLRVAKDFEQKLQTDKEELADQYKRDTEQMRRQIKELKVENRSLKNNVDEVQASLRNEIQRCEILEVKLGGSKQEVELLKENNTKLDVDYHGKEKSVNTLRTRLAVCEQELKDKTCIVSGLQKKIAKISEEKDYLQKYAEELEKKAAQTESTISTLAKEILKANEIIARQESEHQVSTEKMKMAASVALEQEKAVRRKEEEIADLTNRLQKENQTVAELQKEKSRLVKDLATSNESLSACKKKAETDSKVIAWFSRTSRAHPEPNEDPKRFYSSEIGLETQPVPRGLPNPVAEAASFVPSPPERHLSHSSKRPTAPASKSDPASSRTSNSHVPDYVLRQRVEKQFVYYSKSDFEEEDLSEGEKLLRRQKDVIWHKFLGGPDAETVPIDVSDERNGPKRSRPENTAPSYLPGVLTKDAACLSDGATARSEQPATNNRRPEKEKGQFAAPESDRPQVREKTNRKDHKDSSYFS